MYGFVVVYLLIVATAGFFIELDARGRQLHLICVILTCVNILVGVAGVAYERR